VRGDPDLDQALTGIGQSRRLLLVAVIALSATGCMIPGGGGVNQTIPDSVRAGEAATVRLDMFVTDVKFIWGRYRDLALRYRLVGDSAFQSITPSRRIHVDRGREAYEFTIPPYPARTCGSIELSVSMKFDGHPSQFDGYRKIRVIPDDVRIGVKGADTVVVSRCSPAGWAFVAVGNTRTEIEDGEGVRLVVDSGERNSAHVRLDRFAGVPIADITTLRFRTYVRKQGQQFSAPYVMISVDRNADGRGDDELRFFPKLSLDRWQSWDPLNGEWWTRSSGRLPVAENVQSLAAYLAATPNARLAGSILFGAGTLGGSQPSDVTIDAVVLGIRGDSTTYVFRSSEPGPRKE
jgi:hypothetical protein